MIRWLEVKDGDQDWKLRGECLGAVDLFYPGRGEDVEPAKALCRRCPVRERCLEYALTAPLEQFGVWGGTSERERRSLRKARREGAAA